MGYQALGRNRGNAGHDRQPQHQFAPADREGAPLERIAQVVQAAALGQQQDALRQEKKDAIETARLIRLKKIPRPPRPGDEAKSPRGREQED